MSNKKSQAILKCFIDLKSSVWFTLGSENETMFCDTWRLPVKIVKSLSDRQSTLIAESLRSFLDKSRKRKKERGKRKAEGRKREIKKVLSVTKHGFVSENWNIISLSFCLNSFRYIPRCTVQKLSSSGSHYKKIHLICISYLHVEGLTFKYPYLIHKIATWFKIAVPRRQTRNFHVRNERTTSIRSTRRLFMNLWCFVSDFASCRFSISQAIIVTELLRRLTHLRVHKHNLHVFQVSPENNFKIYTVNRSSCEQSIPCFKRGTMFAPCFEPETFLACSSFGGLHNRRTKNLAASEGVARKRAREARGSYPWVSCSIRCWERLWKQKKTILYLLRCSSLI